MLEEGLGGCLGDGAHTHCAGGCWGCLLPTAGVFVEPISAAHPAAWRSLLPAESSGCSRCHGALRGFVLLDG